MTCSVCTAIDCIDLFCAEHSAKPALFVRWALIPQDTTFKCSPYSPCSKWKWTLKSPYFRVTQSKFIAGSMRDIASKLIIFNMAISSCSCAIFVQLNALVPRGSAIFSMGSCMLNLPLKRADRHQWEDAIDGWPEGTTDDSVENSVEFQPLIGNIHLVAVTTLRFHQKTWGKYQNFKKIVFVSCTGLHYEAVLRLGECCGQVEAVVVSNSMN